MAEATKAAAQKLLPKHFKLGTKQLFLPNHVITLLHKKNLPPNEVSFKVPLRFTKFDLRDYLWHLYNVEVTKVRSYVKENPITTKLNSTSTYRPQPDKIMIVELAKPFQWPEVPKDLGPWNNELWSQREKSLDDNQRLQETYQRFDRPMKSREPLSEDRKKLAALAKSMLAGKVQWSNGVALDPKWKKVEETAEAEVDEAAVAADAEGTDKR